MHRTGISALVLLLSVPGLIHCADKAAPEVLRDLYGDPLPTGAVARMGSARFRHKNNIWGVAFAPDGKTLSTVGVDGLRLWETATGRQIRRLELTKGYWDGVTFSPDGKTLAISCRRPSGQVFFDTATGKQLGVLQDDGRRFRSFAFSADGRTLVTTGGSNDPSVCVWEVPTGRRTQLLRASADDAVLSAAGKSIVSVDDNTRVRFWGVASAKVLREFTLIDRKPERVHPNEEDCWQVALARDGSAVATTAERENLCVWEVATGKKRFDLLGPFGCKRLTLSNDGKRLAYAAGDKVVVLDAITGEHIKTYASPVGSFGCVAFSPDGRTLAIGDGPRLHLWEIASGKEQPDWPGHWAGAKSVVFSPSSKLLATAGKDDTLRVWDSSTGRHLRQFEEESFRDLCLMESAAAFTPNSRAVIGKGLRLAVHTWDVETGKLLARSPTNEQIVAVSNSADGRLLLAVAQGAKNTPVLHVSDVETRKEVRTIVLQPDGELIWPCRIAFSPDVSSIAVTYLSAVVRIFDGRTGKEVRRIQDGEPHQRTINGVAYSPDGKVLATCCDDERYERGPEDRRSRPTGNVVRLWEVATGRLLLELNGHTTGVEVVTFSPDGRSLATGAWDGTIRMWEIASGRELARFTDDGCFVNHVAFSPDGERLASAMQDGTALVWAWKPAGWQAQVKKPTGSEADRLWTDLRSDCGPTAHRAIHTLAAFPETALPLLREKLKPVATVPPDRLRRLIRELDHEDFDRRDAAQKELASLGFQAEAELRKELANTKSGEVRRAITVLLEGLPTTLAIRDPATLQSVRGVWVLQRIGTPEARKQLEALAAGAASERLTREAKDALAWLDRRARLAP